MTRMKCAVLITASLFGIAGALPASAQQTAQQTQAQKRYEAWAACRREADSAVPLSNMISEQASMNHYLAMSNCLSRRGYNIDVSEGGTVGPPD
jgi:invasion protein IalB